MKALIYLILILKIATVFSFHPTAFKVRRVSNDSLIEGPSPRIYGGTEAEEGQFKFMIYVLTINSGKLSQCSASLVHPNLVLLAAHCVYFENLRPSDVILIGGKANLLEYFRERFNVNFQDPLHEDVFGIQERRASQIFIHPRYDPINLVHDVALIETDEAFKIGNQITRIPLSEDRMTKMKSCTILGWGLTRGDRQTFKLNFVEDKKVSTTQIGCLYKKRGAFICLKPDNRGICSGDSGSPLVCDGKVWGVASHLISPSEKPDCGDSEEEYYTELYDDLTWLKTHFNTGITSRLVDLKAIFTCLVLTLWASIKS